MLIIGFVMLKCVGIITTQTIIGSKPHKTFRILQHAVDFIRYETINNTDRTLVFILIDSRHGIRRCKNEYLNEKQYGKFYVLHRY